MGQAHFDYRQVTEEKDELDFNNLLPCPHCKKPIPADATMCLYCGQEIEGSSFSTYTWAVWGAIILIIIFVFFIIISIY